MASGRTSPSPTPATRRKLAGHYKKFVTGFQSTWFLIPQGTAIVGLVLHQLDYQFNGLQIISYLFWVAAILLLLTFLLLYITRAVFAPKSLAAALRDDSSELNGLASISITFTTILQMAVVTLVGGWGKGWGLAIYCVWWVNVAMAALSCTVVPFFALKVHRHSGAGGITPVTQLPLIAALTAAAGGGLICAYGELSPQLQVPAIIVSYLLVGMALPLALALDALFLARVMDPGEGPTPVTYQDMILCGPWGQGSFALQILGAVALGSFPALGGGGQFISSQAAPVIGFASMLAGLGAWGFGTFWWLYAIMSIVRAWMDRNSPNRGLEFSLSIWSLIFPVGVYTNGAIQLGKLMNSAAFRVWSTVLAILLVILWLVVLGVTIRSGVIRNKLKVRPD